MADCDLSFRVKICTTCGEEKPATTEHFCRHPNGKFGLQARCKVCAREAVRAWSKTDSGKASRSAWRAKTESREKQRKYDRDKWRDPAYRQRKVASDLERNKRPEVLAKKAARRRERRLLDAQFALREFEFNRSDKRREWRRSWQPKYFRERERRDPQFKLRLRIGTAIRESLLSRGERKNGRKWESLVGYTSKDLKRHLERQFAKGMLWDNYGEWHIDHIISQSSFKYQSPDDLEFVACWAITNLRPLWAEQNSSKGAKRLLLL